MNFSFLGGERCGMTLDERNTPEERMNLHEQVYNIVWILLGIGICTESIRLKLWDVSWGPGPGFIPFLAGFFIGGTGLLLFISESSKGWEKKRPEPFWQDPTTRKRIFYILGGLCAMALLMPILGFLLTSILITSFMLRVIEPQKWLAVIAISLASCFLVYWLFFSLLQVSLPKGLLGV
jgi:putative tricarboxylic transport membrane protein